MVAEKEQILTYAEVERRFPDEWVLLEVLRQHNDLTKKKGRLIAHSAHREDLRAPHARAAASHPDAVLSEWYTGEFVPDGVVVVL